MDGILVKIRKFMSDNCMTDPGDRIVLGVSGGADSMCLLFALWEIFHGEEAQGYAGIHLQVVHVEHGIRGEESVADAAFVKAACESLGIPCRIVSVDCPALAKERGESLEEAGRNARYESFLQSDADCIAVAHHMEDQAETVLANLFRGSALHGMSGMQPVSEYKGKKLIRPLLGITRDEIEEFLAQRQIAFRVDETNADVAYARNRIRANVLPQAKIVNAQAVSHICKTAEHMKSLEEFLAEETEKAYRRCLILGEPTLEAGIEVHFHAESLLKLSPIVSGEVVLCGIRELCGKVKDIGSVHIGDVLELCKKQSGRCIDLPYDIQAVRSGDRLILRKGCSGNEADPTEDFLPMFHAKIMELTEPVSDADIPNEIYTKWFDYDKIHGEILLRTRKPGDAINLSYGTKKLQDYMVNEKIMQSERDRIPILADEDSVLWVVGYRISHRHKVTRETRKVLEVTIQFSERKEQ